MAVCRNGTASSTVTSAESHTASSPYSSEGKGPTPSICGRSHRYILTVGSTYCQCWRIASSAADTTPRIRSKTSRYYQLNFGAGIGAIYVTIRISATNIFIGIFKSYIVSISADY